MSGEGPSLGELAASGAFGGGHGAGGGAPIPGNDNAGLNDGPGIGAASLFPDILHGNLESSVQGYSGSVDNLVTEAVHDAAWLKQSPTPPDMLGNQEFFSMQGVGVTNKDFITKANVAIEDMGPMKTFNVPQAASPGFLHAMSSNSVAAPAA